MSIITPNQAQVLALQRFLTDADLNLKLYKNNHTPADTDTEVDYVEADFIGYAEELLVAGTWSINAGPPADGDYGDVTFTSTAGGQSQTVYGYYVVRRSDGFLMWAEIFSDNDPTAPYTIVNVGDDIVVPLAYMAKDNPWP
jgi:hypothetical protein